jgi:uncharacterized protein with PIN domain
MDQSLSGPAFIVDGMLKGLVKWLRILGFSSTSSADLSEIYTLLNNKPGTAFVTASRTHFSKFSQDNSILLTSNNITDQLRELNEHYGIFQKINLFSICLICNIPVVPVAREKIINQIPEQVSLSMKQFWRCPSCEKIYWQGGHVYRMVNKLRQLKIPVNFKNDF